MNGEPPKPRRGCLFYGCITGIVMLLCLVIAGLVAVHYAKKKLTALVSEYTDTNPMTLPSVQISSADLEKLKKRYADFEAAVKAQRPTPPLVLTADEINALIASSPDKQALKGKFYVSFDGDRVKGELSVPLKEIGWKMVRDRYLNGSGTFNLSLHNGVLFLSPQTIVVKGKPVPEMYMQGIRNANFAQGLTNQPDAIALLQNLQDIQVKDGKLVIVPKEKAEPPAPKAEKE
jgi:hypothetical protein